ncbi:MAG: CDP-diacylglycerol--serine O-phosphatidyltransferase [Gammaproteobacteria bacterium]|nr:CDP-diacylglycerol--serine O-phosphatidyltransferase [Gammaproteobacteria bacterium]MDH5776989.1 CDP-diacylglycerol--serine O-phosphatidyltransferase [Gammaproteobacteria bacterium]
MIKKFREGQPRRGIYLLPNLFTTAALFTGFYAIVAAMDSRFESAAIAIFIAMLLDGIDGRVARLTNTQSDFGAEYDSLADMISFGIGPALIVYEWSLASMGKLGWLAAFIYTAGAALRLARFNTQVGTADKRYFQGLPSPSAAAIIAGMIWVGETYLPAGENINMIAMALTIWAGVLMVSNIRYNSFKGINWKGKVPFVGLLLFVLIIVLVSTSPPLMLFVGFLIYSLSGIVYTLFELRKRRQERRAQHKAANDS